MGSRRGCSLARLVTVLLAATVVVGCSSTEPSGSSSASASASRSSGSPPPICPNPEGGSCLGPLTAGTAYTTRVFTPPLTYRVPTRGWSNYEDTPGNFLLVPPGNDLPGVNAGTSDFIGVYTSVVPGRIAHRHGCVVAGVSGAWTPRRMASWFARQPDLVAGRATPISTGGMRGLVIDLRTKPGARLPSCSVAGERIELAGLFTGQSPSALDHAVIPGMTMRLVLLDAGGTVLLVEIDDVDAAPTSLGTLTAVARQLKFDLP